MWWRYMIIRDDMLLVLIWFYLSPKYKHKVLHQTFYFIYVSTYQLLYKFVGVLSSYDPQCLISQQHVQDAGAVPQLQFCIRSISSTRGWISNLITDFFSPPLVHVNAFHVWEACFFYRINTSSKKIGLNNYFWKYIRDMIPTINNMKSCRQMYVWLGR